MSERDCVDRGLAKRFAWVFAPPGKAVDVASRLRTPVAQLAQPAPSAPPALPVAPVDDRETERTRAEARTACAPFAAAIAHAWALTDERERARATRRLLGRADRLGGEILGMDAYPAEAVRFVRLLVRHAPTMSRRQRERACLVAGWIPLDHPESVDLYVEIARAADGAMLAALAPGDEDGPLQVDDEDALAARLADVVDAGPTHACRAVAIDLLSRLSQFDAAIPALQGALALPSFGVRARALATLAAARPCGVTEADLVRVVRDLVEHGPPDVLLDDDREEEERLMAEAVLECLVHVQPPEIEEDLLDLIDAEHEAIFLDAGWATEALAIAFPETAAAMVDHWLKCARWSDRTRALAALARLPRELAEPRLRLAATDPSYAVREVARRQWLDRFQGSCPVDVSAIVGAPLLAGRPSDRFASRLAVVQGRLPDARRAMSRALLAEAPDPEAVVLLLQLVGEDAESGEPLLSPRPGVGPEGGWAAALVRRFGRAGIEGLCHLAARFPEPESFGWMRRLGDLIEQGIVPKDSAGPIVDLAARHVAADDSGSLEDSLRVLELVGLPPDLVDRAVTIGLTDEPGGTRARDLVIAWADRALDARLASEMALALADRDWPRVRNAASMGLRRGAAAARVIAQRVLELVEQDPDAEDAAVECAAGLRAAGQLTDEWALEALSRPGAPLFRVAARAWRGAAVIRPALEAALESSLGDRGDAVRAAVALLNADPPLRPRDRRLARLLAAAAPVHRAELVCALCVRGAPLSLVGPHLEELLVSSDPAVTGGLLGVAVWLDSPRGRALLRHALPAVVDPDLRAEIQEILGTAAAPFWAES